MTSSTKLFIYISNILFNLSSVSVLSFSTSKSCHWKGLFLKWKNGHNIIFLDSAKDSKIQNLYLVYLLSWPRWHIPAFRPSNLEKGFICDHCYWKKKHKMKIEISFFFFKNKLCSFNLPQLAGLFVVDNFLLKFFLSLLSMMSLSRVLKVEWSSSPYSGPKFSVATIWSSSIGGGNGGGGGGAGLQIYQNVNKQLTLKM